MQDCFIYKHVTFNEEKIIEIKITNPVSLVDLRLRGNDRMYGGLLN